MSDRGRETSYALVEVRTVLSRAETALRYMDNHWAASDPEVEEMRAALAECAARLARWRRTGRPLKSSPSA